jgi:hypothetical protein
MVEFASHDSFIQMKVLCSQTLETIGKLFFLVLEILDRCSFQLKRCLHVRFSSMTQKVMLLKNGMVGYRGIIFDKSNIFLDRGTSVASLHELYK